VFTVPKIKILIIHLTEMSIFVSHKTLDFGAKETPIKFNFHVSVTAITFVVPTFYLSYEKINCFLGGLYVGSISEPFSYLRLVLGAFEKLQKASIVFIIYYLMIF